MNGLNIPILVIVKSERREPSMNFRRIQWIFLVAFIALDIFLGYSYISNNEFTISVVQSTKDESIISEMKNDGIDAGKLSTTRQSGYYISTSGSGILQDKLSSLKGQSASYNNGVLTSNFNQPVKINVKHPDKTLNKIVADKNKILFGSQYVYAADLSSEYENDVIYVQKGPGLNVGGTEGQIRFKVNSENQIISYTQSYLNDVKTLREKERLVSERKAVLYLYQHDEIPDNSKVKWTKLGYTRLLALDDDNAVYIPTWMVAIQAKNSDSIEIKRINAFTGTLSKTDASTISEVTDEAN